MSHMIWKLLNTNSFMFILSPGIAPALLPVVLDWVVSRFNGEAAVAELQAERRAH